jgi:hypothetical protein
MKARSAHGLGAMSSALKPMLTSARSSPRAFVIATAAIASSSVVPAGFRSSAPRRIVSGSRSGQTSRTASIAPRWKRTRFPSEPP